MRFFFLASLWCLAAGITLTHCAKYVGLVAKADELRFLMVAAGGMWGAIFLRVARDAFIYEQHEKFLVVIARDSNGEIAVLEEPDTGKRFVFSESAIAPPDSSTGIRAGAALAGNG